jgi:TolB-like protein
MRGFIEELKHRNVFRVGIAYAVIGWLIAQVADLVVDAFNMPTSFLQMIIVLVALGFPIALFLAWAFELTPEGVVKAEDIPADAPKDPRSGQTLNRITIATLLVAVAWLGWDEIRDRSLPAEAGVPAATVTDKSIAVLPFADFSPDGAQGWFADGLADEILNSLARASDLRVASRTSAFAYRDSEKDIPSIAAELGVAHVLEGSVRRAGTQLRITAQLIRAEDDVHLWSETFDGSTDDSIDFQEQIAMQIANALETAMDPEELERMLSAGTRSIEAWELFVRADVYRDGSFADAADSSDGFISLLEQAVALDPKFADAHLALANFWLFYLNPAQSLLLDEPISDAEARQRFNESIAAAEAFARSDYSRAEYRSIRARMGVQLTDAVDAFHTMAGMRPDRYDSWTQLASGQIIVGDYEGARESLLRARELHTPADGDTEGVFQYLHRVDVPAAFEMAELAVQRTDLGQQTLYQAHRVFLYAGEIERAARLARLHNERSTDLSSNYMVNIRQACAEGRTEDADAVFARLDEQAIGGLMDNRWLFLKTLGRDEDATAVVASLDTPEGMFTLSGFMNYRSFDPVDFPNFNEVLLAQGIIRPPVQRIPFACKRGE